MHSCQQLDMLHAHKTAICAFRRESGFVNCAGRHPDYLKISEDPLNPAVVKDRPDVEADVRYRRVDYSAELVAEARLGFASCLAAGEAQIPLAKAALLIAAEDDAIASSSTVRFPVEAFLQRISRLARDTATVLSLAAKKKKMQQPQLESQQTFSKGSNISSSSTTNDSSQWMPLSDIPPAELVQAIQHCLFKEPALQAQQRPLHQQQMPQQPPGDLWFSSLPTAGFSCPSYGRSNLPPNKLIDHPGVWEDARLAYLNEVLVKKRGNPAALSILYCEVMRQLLLLGAVNFAVTFQLRDFSCLPQAQPLANLQMPQLVLNQVQPPTPVSPAEVTASSSRSASYGSDDSMLLLNTCSSEALVELLRHLKRSYWPFPWDTNIDSPDAGGACSLGGFRAAAKAALGSDQLSAALRAVSATAAHRLARGIWTSPGAGDLNRCLAAAERLVMMVGDERPQERRDLAVLLLHAGQPAAAAAEFAAYMDATKGSQLVINPFDAKLVSELWRMMKDTGIKPNRSVMSVETVLRQGGIGVVDNSMPTGVHKPLTW